MSKNLLLAVAFVLVVAGGMARADSILFNESFNGTIDNDISTLGWNRYDGGASITVTNDGGIDSGSYAVMGRNQAAELARYKKELDAGGYSYTDGVVTMTAVVQNDNPAGSNWWSHVGFHTTDSEYRVALVRDLSGSQAGFRLVAGSVSTDIVNSYSGVIDVKVAAGADTATFSWKQHGAASWNDLWTSAIGTGLSGKTIADVFIASPSTVVADGGLNQRWDSIQLSQAAVPEPGTFALLLGGLIGMVAYAWRKRK
jgi:hypothetical protein